jgi:hypothetical protein
MATSTFYDTIYIDDKAADILIRGLNGKKHPRPLQRSKEEIEKFEELKRLFHSTFEKSATKNSE